MGPTVTEGGADMGWRSSFVLLFAVRTDVITIDRHMAKHFCVLQNTYYVFSICWVCLLILYRKDILLEVEERSFYGTGHFKANFAPGDVFLPPFFHP